MRYGVLVWVGEEVVGVRTGADATSAITLPAQPIAAGTSWWSDPDGPATIAALVAELTLRLAGDDDRPAEQDEPADPAEPDELDELVELVLLTPAQARPELEGALGFAVPDVTVRIVPVDEAVTAVLGVATRVGEWRDGALMWSGTGDRAVVVGPRESVAAIELQIGVEAPDADFLSAERLLERYARTLEPPRDDEPPQVDEDVQFTVYRPRAARPLRTERLVAFAHKSEEYEEDGRLVDPALEVARQAEELLGDLSRQLTTTQDADAPIARGDVLRFVPVVPGIRFNPEALEFRWLRGVHREVFEFVAGSELDGQTVTGRLSVYVGLRLVADVSLRIRVDSAGGGAAQERSRGRVYGKVFPSYSHEDADVVTQIAAAAQTLGHEYLRDVSELRSGQDWQRELERYIEEADVFQLFWSPTSMISPHVQREWNYALSLNRPDFVRPVYWQQPRATAPPKLPPPELDRLHFAYLGSLLTARRPVVPVVAAPAAAAPPTSPPPASAPPSAARAPSYAPQGAPADAARAASRSGLKGALAGVAATAVVGIGVTLAVTGGGAPTASPPAPGTILPTVGSSATAGPSGGTTQTQDETGSTTQPTGTTTSTPTQTGLPSPSSIPTPTGPSGSPGTSVPPDSAPGSPESRALVSAFFADLGEGDADAALQRVCAEQQDALADTVAEQATYGWGAPKFESDEVDGSDRVFVVSVSASDPDGNRTARFWVLVSRSADGPEICGLSEL